MEKKVPITSVMEAFMCAVSYMYLGDDDEWTAGDSRLLRNCVVYVLNEKSESTKGESNGKAL